MKGIICSDFHLRKDYPRCRLDEDWIDTQKQHIRFVVDKANKYEVDIFCCGDLFDSSKVDQEISNMFHVELIRLKGTFWVIPGQHDLPWHKWELVHQASIWPFLFDNKHSALISKLLPGGVPFGKEPEKDSEILFLHTLTFKTEKDKPFKDIGNTAQELLNKYPNAKWVFTGDNHQTFVYKYQGRYVINPGSLNRQDASQKDYQPVIYFINTEEDIIKELLVPDNEKMITDEYLKKAELKEDRIAAFVEKIESKVEVSLNFKSNLRKVLKNPDVKEIKDTVEEICKRAGMEV